MQRGRYEALYYPGDASNRFRAKGDLFCDDILSFIGTESSVEDNEDALHAVMLAASLQGRRLRCPAHNYKCVCAVNRTPNPMRMLALCPTTVSIVGNRL